MPTKPTKELPSLEELREIVAGIIGTEPSTIPDDANLILLGVDSLGMMRLINRFRRAGVRVSPGDLAAEPTLAAWQRRVSELSHGSSP
jgi:aryl carrier-like protein